MDWHSWHGDYDVPGSWLARRLAVVQEQVRSALDACPPGPLTVVSLCAGEGRDLLEGFEEREFDRVWLSDPEAGFGVGVHRLTGRPDPLKLARSMVVFAGYEHLGG